MATVFLFGYEEISSGRHLHYQGYILVKHKSNVVDPITDRAITFTVIP